MAYKIYRKYSSGLVSLDKIELFCQSKSFDPTRNIVSKR